MMRVRSASHLQRDKHSIRRSKKQTNKQEDHSGDEFSRVECVGARCE